jgi:hypothetical protein
MLDDSDSESTSDEDMPHIAVPTPAVPIPPIVAPAPHVPLFVPIAPVLVVPVQLPIDNLSDTDEDNGAGW